MELQPHFRTIPIPQILTHPTSPQISSEIDMIDNMAILGSPSLKLMEKPTLQYVDHQHEHVDLLNLPSFISNLVVDTVVQFQNPQSTAILPIE